MIPAIELDVPAVPPMFGWGVKVSALRGLATPKGVTQHPSKPAWGFGVEACTLVVVLARATDRSPCPGCAETGMHPSHDGSPRCKSGSIASGGTTAHCTCDVCF